MRVLGVGKVPERKSVALWVQQGTEVKVLAYFVDDEAVREFLSLSPTYERVHQDVPSPVERSAPPVEVINP